MGNNRELPTYQKSVALQVTDQPSPAGAAQSMINAFRDFSESMSQVSSNISKQEAQQQREVIKNNISNTYKQFALEALKNPDQTAAMAAYKDSSQQYAKGLLDQSDSYNKPYVSNLVDYYHNEHMFSVEKNAIMQQRRIASVNAYERMNNATTDWVNAINNSHPMVDSDGQDVQFDAAKALLADQLKNMHNDAITSNLDPAVMGRQAAEQTKKFTKLVFLKRYEDHVYAGQGNEYIKELQKTDFNIEGFSSEDKKQLIGEMINIRNQGKSAANISAGQLKLQISDEMKRVAAGGTPNVQLQETVKGYDENAYNVLMRNTQSAQSVYAAKQAAFYKSPEEISQLKKDIKNIDPNDPDYGQKKQTADAALKAIDLQTKEFKQNPMRFIMQDPAIKEVVNNYQQAANSDSVGRQYMNTPVNSTVPKPWNSIIQAQLHRGLTINGGGAKQGSAGNRVRLLENAQVPEMVNDIIQATPAQKIELMNKWDDEYGGGLPFNLVVKQLVDGGMPAQFALLANIDPMSKDAADVAEAVSIPMKTLSEELKKKDSTAVKDINTFSMQHVFGMPDSVSLWDTVNNHSFDGTDKFKSFMNTTTRHAGDVDRAYFNSIASTVQQLAYYYSLTQNVSTDDAVAKAEDVIASRYDYTIINNNEVRIPHNTTGEIVKSYAAKLEPEVLSFPFDTKGYDKSYAMELIRQGHWKNDIADDGLVWVDRNGKLWNDKNGHPLSFSFDEAKTGIRHIETPNVTPKEEQQIDTGVNTEDTIDVVGKQLEKRGKVAGKKFHSLMESVKGKNNA